MVEKLQSVIESTESIYLDLADKYPKILTELEGEVKRSRQHLQELSGGSSHREENLEDQILSLLSKTGQLIESIAGSYENLYQKDDNLYQSIESGISSLSSLEGVIGKIETDSREMALISLNAMTVAIKAGNQGRGFSFITEELQKLSEQTIDYTEKLTKKGESLLKRFRSYKNSLEEVRQFQADLTIRLREGLQEDFKTFGTNVQESMETLNQLTEKSRSVRNPLLAIMQEIQLQDIIKQSVDHVILSLEELEKYESSSDKEAKLDELTFVQLLPDLCSSVLQDVNSKLQTSMETFEKKTDAVHAIVAEVQHRRDVFNGTIQNEQTTSTTLHNLFNEANQRLDKLIRDIDTSMDKKRSVSQEGKILMKEVQGLEDNLNSFSSLIRRFHNINVASRIEVAKQSVLGGMDDTVLEMTSLTERIEEDIENALSTTRGFIETTYSTVMEYSLSFTDQQDAVDEYEFQIEQSRGRMKALQESILRTISGFNFFSDSFTSLLQHTSRHLQGLQDLVDDIEDIQYTLENIKENASTRLQNTLKQMNRTDWAIHSEKLQEIIDRFTIFTHKKTAGEIGGFEVETETAQSGDVTLF